MSNPKLTHDIRNCLNAITMNAELGKLCIERANDSAAALRALNIILAECRKCAELITPPQPEE